MHAICAWCGDGDGETGAVSHGICAACLEQRLEALVDAGRYAEPPSPSPSRSRA